MNNNLVGQKAAFAALLSIYAVWLSWLAYLAFQVLSSQGQSA